MSGSLENVSDGLDDKQGVSLTLQEREKLERLVCASSSGLSSANCVFDKSRYLVSAGPPVEGGTLYHLTITEWRNGGQHCECTYDLNTESFIGQNPSHAFVKRFLGECYLVGQIH